MTRLSTHRALLAPLALTIAALLVAASSPAIAAPPSWSPVITRGGNTLHAAIAVTPDGHASALFLDEDFFESDTATATRAPGAAWSTESVLDTENPHNGPPGLTASGATAIGVWGGEQGNVRAATRTGGGAWSAPVLLSSDGTKIQVGAGAQHPVAASNQRGDVAALWRTNNAVAAAVVVTRRRPDGTWTPPAALSDLDATPGLVFDLAVGESGAMAAVWTQSDGANDRLMGAYRPAGGPWRQREVLSAAGRNALEPTVTVGPSGDVVAAWTRSDGSNNRVQVAYRPVDGFWSAPVTLSAATRDAGQADIAVDPQGRFTAVWVRSDGTNFAIQSSARSANGTWGPVADLSSAGSGTNHDQPTAVADHAGNITVVWRHGTAVRSARRSATGAWEPSVLIGQGNTLPNVPLAAAVDGRGNVTAAWTQQPSPSDLNHVAITSLDVVGPRSFVTAPTAPFTLGDIGVGWSATDEISAITGYDTRVTSAPPAGPFTAPTAWHTATTDTAATYTPTTPGRTYCFSARAADEAGHTGAYSAQRCSAVPLDDRALKATPGWTDKTAPGAYAGTFTVARNAGQTLSSSAVAPRRIALVATTCDACGRVDVFLGDRKLVDDLSLRTATTKRAQLIPVKTFPARREGRVRIVTQSDQPVMIEGLGVSSR